MRAILLVLGCLMISGCATPTIDWSDPNQASQRLVIEHDSFKQVTWYNGPWYQCKEGRIRLRAWEKDGTPGINHQIYIDSYCWPDDCYDSWGNKLRIVRLSPSWHQQDIAINVDRNYLMNRRFSGIQLRFYGGRLDQEDFSLPGGYVVGFLGTVEPNEPAVAPESSNAMSFIIEGPNEPNKADTTKPAAKATDTSKPESEPVDVNTLKTGVKYEVLGELPLMPDFDPDDPLNAITRIEKIREGDTFVVTSINRRSPNPWYFVETTGKESAMVRKGWINSVAMKGQVGTAK